MATTTTEATTEATLTEATPPAPASTPRRRSTTRGRTTSAGRAGGPASSNAARAIAGEADAALLRVSTFRAAVGELHFTVRALLNASSPRYSAEKPTSEAEVDALFGWTNYSMGEADLSIRRGESLASGWDHILEDVLKFHELMMSVREHVEASFADDPASPRGELSHELSLADELVADGERAVLDALAAGAWLSTHGFVKVLSA